MWKARLENTRNGSGDLKYITTLQSCSMKVIAGERYGIEGRFVFLFVFNGWHSACSHSEDSCIVEGGRVRLREAVQEWFGKSFLDPTSSHSSSQNSGGRDGDRIGTASKSPSSAHDALVCCCCFSLLLMAMNSVGLESLLA